jgi:hypothetical protein
MPDVPPSPDTPALVQRLRRDLQKRLKIPSQVLQAPSKLLALYGNFLAADAVKQVLVAAIPVDPKTRGLLPAEILDFGRVESAMLRLQVFYALMYVVVEGYRELDYHDPEVDRLLAQSDLVEAFRRFRNATFHFQKDPLTPKFRDFLEAKGSEDWSFELYAGFNGFFDRNLPIKEFIDSLPKRGAQPDNETNGPTAK